MTGWLRRRADVAFVRAGFRIALAARANPCPSRHNSVYQAPTLPEPPRTYERREPRAEAAGIPGTTFHRARRELEAAGAVETVTDGSVSRYRGRGARCQVPTRCQTGTNEVPRHPGHEGAEGGSTVPPPYKGGTGGTTPPRTPADGNDTAVANGRHGTAAWEVIEL